MTTLSDADEKLLFTEARTHNGWLPKPVDEALLRRAYDLAKMGPTAANTQPLRIVFVRTPEGKARLKPTLSPGNVDKTMAAPVTAILAYDMEFYEKLPKLFPHADARSWFVGSPEEKIDRGAYQNGSLQAAYFILAARGLGLDCGPMGGFDSKLVDAEFLKGTPWRSLMLVNVGYGDATKLFPRSPRLEFDEACRFE